MKIFSNFKKKRISIRKATVFLRRAVSDDSSDTDELKSWIVHALESPYWEVKNIAVKLVRIYRFQSFLSKIESILTDKDEKGFIRRNAADTLKVLGNASPDVIAALRAGLKDSYWEVRTHSALAIAEIASPDQELESQIIQMLMRPNWKKYRSYPIWRPINRLYKELNFEVRAAYASALGTVMTSRDNLKIFKFLLKDDYWKVRVSALESFFKVADRLHLDENKQRSYLNEFDTTCTDFKPLSPVKISLQKVVAEKQEDKPVFSEDS